MSRPSSKCPRCSKAVYFAERASGPGGDWHKSCLTCADCKKRLDSTTLAERGGEAYCKACYGKNFGPKGFGYGCAATMHTGIPRSDNVVNAAPAAATGSTVPSATAAPASPARAKFCSSCGAAASGGAFCSGCGNKLA